MVNMFVSMVYVAIILPYLAANVGIFAPAGSAEHWLDL
jgi:hypothetical protein